LLFDGAGGGISAKGTRSAPNAIMPFDTLNRLLRIDNCVIMGGAAYTRKYAKSLKIKAGSDTLIANNPEFSWYDFVDYERSFLNERMPVVGLFYPTIDS